jgi:melanoma-associated antigen
MACPRKMTMEQYLTLLIRQGYLDRIKTGSGAPGPGAGTKRGRAAARGEAEEGEFNLEWRWGERAQVEISERGVCDFMVEFMVERSRPEGGRPEGAVAKRERLIRVEKQMRRDIKRAAASELSGIGDEQDRDEGGGENNDEGDQ